MCEDPQKLDKKLLGVSSLFMPNLVENKCSQESRWGIFPQ